MSIKDRYTFLCMRPDERELLGDRITGQNIWKKISEYRKSPQSYFFCSIYELIHLFLLVYSEVRFLNVRNMQVG